MPQKSKTGRDPKKVEKPKDQKEQSARFIEAARKVGVDETGREFDSAIRRIIPPKK